MPNDFTHKDWIESILHSKEYLLDKLDRKEADKALATYHPYLINKQIAPHPNNIFKVNEMNRMPWIDKKMQYDFNFHTLPMQNKYAKKRGKSNPKLKETFNPTQFDAVKKYYNYNNAKTKDAMRTLSREQIHKIVYFVNNATGGKK